MTSESKTLKYQIIKQHIIEKINRGELLPGQMIPSENELMEQFEVSHITVRKSMADLVNEGIIYRIKGKGSYVSSKDKNSNVNRNLIALVLPEAGFNDSSLMKIIKGISSYSVKKNYSLIIENTDKNVEIENQVLERLLQNNISGVIISPTDSSASVEMFKRIKNEGIPIVLVDRDIKGIPTSCVTSNNYDGAYTAVDYLIGLGHKKIAFLSYEFNLSSEKDRFRGYCDALESANIEYDEDLVFLDEKFNADIFVQKAKSKCFTAIFAVNDKMALKILNICLENNIKIPEDVSIIGFDDFEASKYAKVPLSTMRQHFYQLGYEAARLLFQRIHNKADGHSKYSLPTQLIVRESTKKCER